jgi:dipeptidyl aminopeptidase/acylaminoacyl peptidase
MSQTHFDFARYMNIRQSFAPLYSPDGTRLLFLSNITGVPQVWSQDLDGGWPRQLTYDSERVSVVFQSGDGRIIFAMDDGGNEHDALFLMSPDGATVTPLTSDPSSIHRPGPWSPDGRRVVYAVNDRDRRYFDLYLLDFTGGDTPEPLLIHRSDHTNVPGCWTPDGRGIVIRRWDTPSNHDLLLLDLETGDLVHLTPHEGNVRYLDAGFSPDRRSLYVTTDNDRDFLTPARLDVETRSLDLLDETPWDAECLSLSPEGTRLAYAHNVDGYSRLRVWDLIEGRHLPDPELEAGVIQAGLAGGALSWSPDGERIAFTYHSPTRHMDVWTYAPRSGDLRRVTFSPDGAIPRDSYAVPETIRYESFDGLQIPALYYRPRGVADKLPVVVRVHGGPEGQSRPIFDAMTQYFVNRGYAVLLPNVRGSTGYGTVYSHLDDVRRRMDSVRDLAACVDWLIAHGDADPARIAVMGGSYGGFMTLAAVTNYPELWAAGVDIVGIANWRTFLENTGPFRRKHREAEYGNLEEDGEFLDEISPIHKADAIRAPMIILHGANDPRVPVGESEQIVSILREREVPVVYHRYPDEGHGLVKLHNKVHGYTAIGEFLDTHVIRGVHPVAGSTR